MTELGISHCLLNPYDTVSIVKKEEGVYLEEQLLKWKKSGLSNFYTSFVVVKIHVTYRD